MSLDLGTLTGYLELDGDKFDSVIDKMPDKLKGSGALMGVAAAGVAALVGAALSDGLLAAVDAEAATDKVTASLGLTESESARIGAVAGKLYADAYGESIEDVNAAVEDVVSGIDGMRGATEDALNDMTAKALNFAGAFEIETARSTQVVGQLLKSGLVKDADEAFDLLTATMQKVPKNVREDIMDAADEYGPFFASMGMDGAEAFNLLASSADKGMFGIDKAGDAVKEFTIRATDLGDTGAQDALSALGLSGQDMANQLLAGGETAAGAMDTIVGKLLSVKDPAEQAAMATALFGTPLEDLGKDSIPGFLAALGGANDVLGETAGAADAMGEALNGNAKTGWVQLQRTWDSIIGQAGGALLPVLSAVLDFLNENPAVLQVVATAVGILAAAFVGLTVATWAMNTALLANPITWIVLGIVALIAALVLLVANWDSVVAWISDVWGGFIGWFEGVMDGFLSWWDGLWSGLMSGIQAGWEAVVAWFEGIPGAVLAFFAGVGEWLLDVGRMLLEGLATGLALGIVAIHYFFTQFPIDVLNFLVGVGEWLVQAGIDLLTGLSNGIVAGWNFVVAWFQALPGRVLAFLVTVGTWLLTTGQSLLQGFLNGIAAGWNFVVSWFTALPGRVLAFLAAAGSWLISSGSNLINGVRTGIVNGWNAVVSWFRNLPNTILGFFAGAGRWLWDIGRNMIDGLLGGIRSLGSTIGNFFLDLLPDWIVGPFKAALGIHSPSTVFAEFGRNIVQGIPVGMDDEQDNLDRRVRDLVSVPDGSVGSQYPADVFGAQRGADGPVRVSLEGARFTFEVDGRQITGIIREQIADASEERRGELVNQVGGVVFS